MKKYAMKLVLIFIVLVGLTSCNWIRHETATDGKSYYLFCLPEEWGIKGNLPNEMFEPEVSEWCDHH